MIVSYPVRQHLVNETSPYPSVLVANTCSLLSTIVSELAATATGLEVSALAVPFQISNKPQFIKSLKHWTNSFLFFHIDLP